MTKKYYTIFFVLLCALVFASCGTAKDPAAGAVEDYINALVDKDFDRMSALSCAEWVPDARTEFDSFQAIKTKVDGLSCTATGSNKEMVPVVCEGKVVFSYNNEDDQDLDLSLRIYKVVNQGGEFLVCGYQE